MKRGGRKKAKSGKEEASSGSGKSSKGSGSKGKGKLDALYVYDEGHIDLLQKEKPWQKDSKYFKNTKVSSLAAMKMVKHALAGVKKGQESGGKPLEVMGLLLGKPEGNSIIIMDCFPLPVEGSETKVVADDDEVTNYMINLSDSLEERRKEKFIGWYHSHPFDVETYSHCFLSGTDISTQLAWQLNLDPKWVAIVVDPLRSLAKQEPQFGAFRCYPPAYSPPQNECPDGTVILDDSTRTMRWGKLYNRYYALNVSYFMSELGKQMLDIMSRNHLWIRVLSGSSIMETENRARFSERILNMTGKLETTDMGGHGGGMRARKSPFTGGGGTSNIAKASQAAAELSIEQCQGHASQITKNMLFNPRGLG